MCSTPYSNFYGGLGGYARAQSHYGLPGWADWYRAAAEGLWS
jgi:hypothetical protein